MRRRNPIKCPLCNKKDLYFTEDKICSTCEHDLERGRKLREQLEKEDSDQVVVVLGSGFLYDHKLPAHLKEYGALREFFSDSLPRLILSLAAPLVDYAYYQEHNKDAFYPLGGGDHMAVVSKTAAARIKRLVDWIGAIKHDAYADGYRDGSALLRGLANGSVSVEEFNEESNKH